MSGKEWLQKLAWWTCLGGGPFALRATLGLGWPLAVGVAVVCGVAAALAVGLLCDAATAGRRPS
jgi:uncharacterized membrane protein YdcZ (DUF606 family)